MSPLHYGLTPKMKPVSPRRTALVAALDIGTSKIACLIARLKPHAPQEVLRRRSHGIEILGIGHTGARGMKAGAVVNLDEAEEAVRHAVDLAERAAVGAARIGRAVGLGRAARAANCYAANVNVAGLDRHRRRHRARARGRQPAFGARRPRRAAFAADRLRARRRPRHARAARHAGAPIRRRHACRDRRRGGGAQPDAGGRALPSRRSRPWWRRPMSRASRCWPTTRPISAPPLIDMGAGTTTIAVFSGGRFIHADGFALGGNHVTMDFARGLNARIADAERIKTFYGSVLAGGSDERDMIDGAGGRATTSASRRNSSRARRLVRIIKPRVEEILEMVRDRLAASPFAAEPRAHGHPDRRREPAHRLAGARRAHSRPAGPHRPPARHRRPAGSGQGPGLRGRGRSAGLSAGGASRTFRTAANAAADDRDDGYIARVGRWLRESF